MKYLLIKPLKIYNKDASEILDVIDQHDLTDMQYPDHLTVKFRYDKKMWWCYRDEILSSIHGDIADRISGTLALPAMHIYQYDDCSTKQVMRILPDNQLLLDDSTVIPQESLDYVVLFRNNISLREEDNIKLKSGIVAYPSVRLVKNNEIEKLIEHLNKYDSISFDTETLGLLPLLYNLDDPTDFLVSISLSTDPNSGYFIKNDKSQEFVKLIYFLADKHLLVHNASFDIAILNIIYGIEHSNFDDTRIMAKLLNENLLSYSLKTLAKDVLGKGDQLKLGDFDYLEYINDNQYDKMEYLLAYYAVSDSANTLALYNYIKPKLESDVSLYGYYKQIEIPSILPVAIAINKNGLTVDSVKLAEVKEAAVQHVADCVNTMTTIAAPYIHNMNAKYYDYQRDTIDSYCDNAIAHFIAKGTILTDLDEDITRQLVQTVNYGHLPPYGSLKSLVAYHNRVLAKPKGISQYTLQLNNKQFMEELMYSSSDGFMLPLQRSKLGAASFNKAALDQLGKYIHAEVSSGNTAQSLIDAGEFFKAFKGYTKTRKLLDAFILPTIELMKVSKDGKVHASYNLLGTVSSRASCNNPNFQQLADNKLFDLRACFTVEDKTKYSFLQFDYTAQEIFIMAVLSQDPVLLDIIKSGGDAHAETVRKIWPALARLTDAEIVAKHKDKRTIAKVVLLSLAYGARSKKMAYILGIPIKEAEDVLFKFKNNAYPVLTNWLDTMAVKVEKDKIITVLGGYKRRFVDAGSKWANAGQVRSIVNSMIQGAASYITKVSTLRVIDALTNANIPYTLAILIHDSMSIQVPDAYVIQAYKVVEQAMAFEYNGYVLKASGAVNKDMSKNTEQSLDEFLEHFEDEL